MYTKSYYIHGKPYDAGHGSYYRIDTFHGSSYADLNGQTDRLRCASIDDDTPLHSKPYNADCVCCWLGHPHTQAEHTKALQR